MPLYFFSITHNGGPSLNSDGLEFADDVAAWQEATMATGEVLRELDGSLKPGDSWKMEVSNTQGKLIYVLTFGSKAL